MKGKDLSLILFRLASFSILGLGLFFIGFLSGAKKLFPYDAAIQVVDNLTVATQEIPVMLGMRPEHYLQPERKPGAGVTINELTGNGDYVALSSFYDGATEIRLIRRDGEVVARWPAPLSRLVPDRSHVPENPTTDWNVDLHGMWVEPDGSVVFNFEYVAMVKLDRCGELVWSLPHMTHHSIEPAADGGYWVPGRRHVTVGDANALSPLAPPYWEDLLLRVSADGEIERSISVPKLFFEPRLFAMLTATGASRINPTEGLSTYQIVHMNDIEELSAELADDFPQFEAGDLVLSIRSRNMIMVVDPDDERVKWWQVGPWLRQHDPDFQPGGRITLFDNRLDDTPLGQVFGGSRILSHDPAAGETRTVWASSSAERMYTPFRGKHEMRPGGGVLIIETNGGRVIETDASGRVVWEYINRYDEDEVVEITGARVLPAAYFDGVDWSCNPARTPPEAAG